MGASDSRPRSRNVHYHYTFVETSQNQPQTPKALQEPRQHSSHANSRAATTVSGQPSTKISQNRPTVQRTRNHRAQQPPQQSSRRNKPTVSGVVHSLKEILNGYDGVNYTFEDVDNLYRLRKGENIPYAALGFTSLSGFIESKCTFLTISTGMDGNTQIILNPPNYQEAINHSNAAKMTAKFSAQQNTFGNNQQCTDRKTPGGNGSRPQGSINNNSAPKRQGQNREARQQQQQQQQRTQKPHQMGTNNSRAPKTNGVERINSAHLQSTPGAHGRTARGKVSASTENLASSSPCTMLMLIGGRCLWTVSIGNYEYVPTGCVAKLANMARDTVIDDLWRLNLEIRYIRRIDDPNIKAALVRNNVARRDEVVTTVPLKSVPVILRAFLGKHVDDAFMANLDEVSREHIRNKRLGRLNRQ